MSVLMVAPDDVNGPAVVNLLVSEGDDVGAIVPDATMGERWKAMGAYVAVGSPDDADLIERAAQHARTIVLFNPVESIVRAAIQGARLASSSPARIVLCGQGGETSIGTLEGSGLEYVVLQIPVKRRGLRRSPPPEPERVAEAVNAADDLAGELRLVLDLTRDEAWNALGLLGPAG